MSSPPIQAHDHSAMSSSSMSMSSDAPTSSGNDMTFTSSINTAFLSDAWVPHSTSTYAGTCIFFILLAVAFRFLLAGKHLLEQRWHDQNVRRRYVRVRDRPTEAEKIDASDMAESAKLITARGAEENVKVLMASHSSSPDGPGFFSAGPHVMPWRISTDVPRAVYVTLLVGVAYLLMLGVMTMNVGYFMSILGGTFLGELIFGRYIQAFDH